MSTCIGEHLCVRYACTHDSHFHGNSSCCGNIHQTSASVQGDAHDQAMWLPAMCHAVILSCNSLYMGQRLRKSSTRKLSAESARGHGTGCTLHALHEAMRWQPAGTRVACSETGLTTLLGA
jgi:hypothetical protein